MALPALAASLIFVVVASGYVLGGPLGIDMVAVVCRAVASAALLSFALAIPLEALVLRGSVASQLKDR